MKCILIKYIESVLWRVAKGPSYTEDARCLKVNLNLKHHRRIRMSAFTLPPISPKGGLLSMT